MNTTNSIALDSRIILDEFAEGAPNMAGLVRTSIGDVPVSWACYRGAVQVGGSYVSHAAASTTINEFPAYFAGCVIRPVFSVYADRVCSSVPCNIVFSGAL